MLSENFRESEYGLSLFLTSQGNLEDFPNNKANAFNNIFSHGINLDHDKNYEVTLASFHLPSYVKSLVKNDFENSYIEYRLGFFKYNEYTLSYDLDKESSYPLFKLAPDKDFSGIYLKEHENLEHKLHSDLTQKKSSFINSLSKSLKLSQNASQQEKICYKLYTDSLYSSELNSNGVHEEDNLMCQYFKDYDLLFFKNLNHFTHSERIVLAQKLAIGAGIEENTFYNHLIKVLPNPHSFPELVVSMNEDGGEIHSFEDYIKYLEGAVDENFINIPILPKLTHTEVTRLINSKNGILDHAQNRVESNKQIKEFTTNGILCVYITFGSKMTRLLNLNVGEYIISMICGFPKICPYQYRYPIHLNYYKENVSSILIYTDLVGTSVRIGGSVTNLLEILSFSKSGNVLHTSTKPLQTFRPLKHNTFKKASVEIRTLNGELINFPDEMDSIIEIYIRPRD